MQPKFTGGQTTVTALALEDFRRFMAALAALPERADDSVFEEFYAGHWLQLVAYCQADARSREVAEDVAGQAFADLWRRWCWMRSYSDPALRGWVYAAARRGLRQSWARRRREMPLDEHEAAA